MSKLPTRNVDTVAAHASYAPDKLAVHDLPSETRLPYRQLDARIDACAWWLAEQPELGGGARIAWLGRNEVDQVVCQIACGRTGRVFVPLNWRLAPAELAYQLADAECRLLVFDPQSEAQAQAVAAEVEGLRALPAATVRAELDECAAAGRRGAAGEIDANAPMTLLYTSGTSGKPKGVIITTANTFFSAVNLSLLVKYDDSAVVLCDMPLFHVVGLTAISRSILYAGGTLLMSDGFDQERTLARLGDPALGVTHYFCVPQMAQIMLQQPDFAAAGLSRLRAFITGGAPNPPDTIRRLVEHGVMMVNGFGMTEAGSVLNMPLGDLELIGRKAGSVGVPLLSTQVRLVDDDGNDVPTGEIGELWLRGPAISPGYWNRPDANAEAFVDGWFRTGDAACCDEDGFYWLVDRRKDMFISGGENVYPAEVEGVLIEMRELAEVAVVGVPDARWGEVGAAYLVPLPGANVSVEDVLAHCGERLARYKIPKHVFMIERLPRTASGKVQKAELRKLFSSSTGNADAGQRAR
ncbi:MAG: AMP-binding protein [Spongiibacteraceae bacterium]|jgi:fatty-acyl-CoA synthase|nr:AMP-binding protein [Spongiibacteraceae bacterium]